MEDYRKFTEQSIEITLDRIKNNYMQVYDHYYSNQNTRTDAILKDLVDCLGYLDAVLSIYTEHYKIYPGYAIEKLTTMKSYINSSIVYFEHEERGGEYE